MKIQIRIQTDKMCLYSMREPEGPIRVARLIQDALNALPIKEKVEIKFINILDLDPESPDYNPDGMIGHFIIQADIPSPHTD